MLPIELVKSTTCRNAATLSYLVYLLIVDFLLLIRANNFRVHCPRISNPIFISCIFYQVNLFLLNLCVNISRELIIALFLRIYNMRALFLRAFITRALFWRVFNTQALFLRAFITRAHFCVKNHAILICMCIDHAISSFGLRFLIVA